MNNYDDLATLRLKIDTVQPLHVRQLGAILEKLSIAYDRYGLPHGGTRGRNRLGLDRLEIRCVIVDMIDVAAATVTLYENRELLGGFVAQLGDVLAALRSHSTAQAVMPADRNAVEAMATPVATGVASRLSLSVVGDNNNIFVIERDAAIEVTQMAATARLRRLDDPAAEARSNVARVAEGHKPTFAQEVFRQLKGSRDNDDGPLMGSARHVYQQVGESLDPITQEGSRHGTVLSVGDAWYVRLEGLSGVLVPLTLKGEGALANGQLYEFQGELEFQNARPVRYVARTAIPI